MTPPDEIWELPTTHIGRRVLVYDTVLSTNDIAADLPAADGAVIFGREQTAGRGQYGRVWHSQAGQGVWSSTVVAPTPALQRAVILTGWSAISVCEALAKLCIDDATIKWPNDIYVRGKKVSGVLIEQRRHTIVGIGVNVNHTAADFNAANLPDATSLAILLGRPLATDDVAKRLFTSMDREYGLLLSSGAVALEPRWQARLGLLGQPVRVELHGGRSAAGVLRELTFERLTLAANDGTSQVLRPEEVRQIVVASN